MNLKSRALWLLIGLSAASAEAAAAAACAEHLKFLEPDCAQWQSHVLPLSIPAARGNAVADDESAAVLGMRVFYDNRFSKAGSGVACVNCHDPEQAFTERKPTAHTIREGRRNTLDLINAAWFTRSHFWDGKVDNLWSAPLFAFEQEDEMGSSRVSVVRTLAAIYRNRYEKIFGRMPDLSDTQRFPSSGKPGDPQFDVMSAQDKDLINHAYANLGKALEAYVRKLAAGRSPFDDFMNGSAGLLNKEAQRGMIAFTRHGCGTCHSGPAFTDEGFHDLGNPAQPGRSEDPARAGGVTLAGKWQFSSTSVFADQGKGEPKQRNSAVADEATGFRTASLRNVEFTSPYGHDGQFATLDQAIDAHSRVLPAGRPLDAQDKLDIIQFLRSLSGRPPQRPWNYWPGG